MAYLNKINAKNGQQGEEELFDVHDIRVPEAAVEDAGKVVKVGADGSFELGESGIPPLPSDASSKTYVIKAVNGTIQWVEEVGQ